MRMQAIRVWPVTSRLLHDGYVEDSRPTPRRTGPRPTMDYSHFLIIAGLILVNAYFVAAEFALVKVRTSQIDQLVEEGELGGPADQQGPGQAGCLSLSLTDRDHGRQSVLGRAIQDWVEPLVAVAFEKLPKLPVIHHGLGWLGPVFRWLFGLVGLDFGRLIPGFSVGIVPVAALCLVTFLHMALGEQAPKTLAIRAPRILALVTAPPLVLIAHIFWPVIWLLNTASNLTLRVLGLGRASAEELTHTEEELRHILLESAEGGHLSRSERIMIENVLNLEQKTAQARDGPAAGHRLPEPVPLAGREPAAGPPSRAYPVPSLRG